MCSIAEIVSPNEEEYFDREVVLTDREVFIDCGGFDGDTSVAFVKRCNGNYRDIIIFEPELCKKEAIEKNLGCHRFTLYQSGVWSQQDRLYFDALDTVASRVSETESGYVISAVALDDMVYDRAPTYIKMDIEGSELEALKGSRKIIENYKPKLAVCIYHKPEDLFLIPLLIREMNPSYRFYVRQYADARQETVLYAI